MYSPKIREDLIPRIYRAARGAKIPMTRWVNRLIEEALPEKVEIDADGMKMTRKERRNHGRYGT